MSLFNKIIAFGAGITFSLNAWAQNLVLNPSFETVNTGSLQCSWYTTQGQFSSAISNWTVPTGGSTDIFHSSLATSCYCSPWSTNASSPGQQAPRTGNAFVNIVTYGSGGCTPYREYIQGQLCTPLVVGVTYEVEMWVTLADNMNKGTNNIGVKFGANPVNVTSMCVYNVTPELNYTGPIIMDKTNWTQILFTYTPTVAGLDNFIIGNFFSDANTSIQNTTGSQSTIRYFIDDVRISVANPPTAGTNGTLSICPGQPSANLFSQLGGSPSTTGTWSGPSTLTGGYLGTYNPSTMAAGTYTYTVNQAGSCTPGTVSATVVVSNPGPSTPTITPIAALCANSTPVNLTANVGGGTWSGTGITNASNGTFNPTTAGAGTHTISYTISGACGGSDTEQITVNPVQNAAISNAGPFCVSAPAVQLTSVNSGGTWSGNGITNAANGTFDPATAGIGTHTITYTLGGACGDAQSISIVVNSISNATITPIAPLCANATVIQLTAAQAGGTWSGTGITNATTGTFDPATAGVGTHTITYTIAGSCGNSDTEQITVDPVQDASIANAGPFCVDVPAVQLTSTNPGGTWSGNGITNATTGTFDPATAGVGTHTITYTLSGNCGDSQSISIVVNAISDPTITPIAPICANAAAIQLTAAQTGGTWSGTGITNGTTGTFDPATAGVGTHTITYTITGSCGNSDTEQITVDPVQDASIANAGPFCVDVPAVQLTSTNPGGTWSGNGITNATTGTFDPATAGVGTHTITYTLSGNCGDSQSISIVVNAISDPTITPIAPICANAAAIQLTAAQAGGTWSGTGITNGTTGTFDPATAGVGTHTVTYTITGSCGNSDTEQITVDPVQNAAISNAGPFCVSASPVQLTSVNLGGTWSGAGITNATTGTFDPATAGVGTHTITYTLSGNCGDAQSISIVVNAVSDPTITPIAPVCANAATVNFVAAETGGTWSGTGITNTTTGTFDPATAGVGTHTITYTITGSCGNSDTEQITVDPVQDASIANAGPFCIDVPAVQLTSTNPGGTWSGNGITNATTGTFDPATAGIGTHTITYTLSGNCGDAQSISIVVKPLPLPSFSATPLEGCVPFDVTFTNNGNIGTNTSVLWNFGDGIQSNANSTVSHTYSSVDCFDVSLTVIEDGCSNTITNLDYICSHANAVADFSMAGIETGDAIEYTFTNSSQNATDYLWDFGDNQTATYFEGVHSYPQSAANYSICLTASNIYGCNDEICQTIVVEDNLIFYIPNAFTPDDDEYNPTFSPVFTSGFDMYDFSFYIYNRWGELIWESHDATIGWDGTYNGGPAQDGIYTWKVEFKTSKNDERMTKVGHLNLLR